MYVAPKTNKAIVMQEFTHHALTNPLGVKGLMKDNKIDKVEIRPLYNHKINARLYKLTMIQNVSHIALGHFIAQLSQHSVF